jgi:hypothetical protein
MEEIKISAPSARVLGKMKKGHKVRISPHMDGEGFSLMVCPERYNIITKTFNKGKGLHVELNPEEIQHNHACGVFGALKKVAKVVGHKAVEAGKKHAPALGKMALEAGAKYAGADPSLVALAGRAGEKLGSAGGEELAKHAHKEIEARGLYAGRGLFAGAGFGRLSPPSRMPTLDMLNRETGQNMGHLARATLGKAHADAITAQNMPNYSKESVKQYVEPPLDGMGLYAGAHPHRGRGLERHPRHRREMSSVGVNGNLLGHEMPPALMSQPYSANFQLYSRLPPAFHSLQHMA